MKVLNPLEIHLRDVIAPVWNYAKRCETREQELQNAILGLVGEAGETADIIKKQLYHQPKDYTEKLGHELGDLAFYFAKVLELTGFTLEQVLALNKEKLQSRHPELGQVSERFGDGYIK